jgi:hypothetical protein
MAMSMAWPAEINRKKRGVLALKLPVGVNFE